MIRTTIRNLYLICASLCIIHSMHSMAPTTITDIINSNNFLINSGIAIAPNGERAYVVSSLGLNVIDLASNSVINTILSTINPIINTFPPSQNIAITSDSNTAYVASGSGGAYNQGDVRIFDLVSETVEVLESHDFNVPTSIALSADDHTAYVLNSAANGGYPSVSIVDLISKTVTDTIYDPSFKQPFSIASNGTNLYVTNSGITSGQGSISIIDLNTHYVTTIDLAGVFFPVGIAISPDGNTAYVAGYGLLGGNYFNVLSIDLYTGNPIAALGTGPNFGTDIAITPDGKTAYVTNGLNLFLSIPENVSVIDVTYNTIIKTITDPEVLPGPWSVAITPDGTSVYVSDIESFYTSSPIGSVVVLSTPKYSASILPPSSISGCKTRNVFLFQTDYINNITWTAPTVGTPVSYNIYRDAALTQLAANVPASGTLQYYDHGRQPNVVYSYYITSVDANGNESIATSVTVTQNC